MLVEMWADVICPICGITHHRLQRALARFEHADEVEVVHRSFEIHPDLPEEGITQNRLALQSGRALTEVNPMLERLEHAAEADGFAPYRIIDRTMGPTPLTHELLAFATAQGKHHEAWDAAFRAHFSEGRQLWTIDQLVEFAAEIGLDPDDARRALETRRFRAQVVAEKTAAERMGAHGTPFIVIDGQYGLSGGMETAAFVDALRYAWNESHPAPQLSAIPGLSSDGAACTPDGCTV
ncbi:DsbA family protein [Herbiconiux sp. P17]|uniref:DsbA family oxidoreductase n=1 Tax=Herbiconiux wuyangfengii TaxID=3342794 RepID=UPI0035B9ABCA